MTKEGRSLDDTVPVHVAKTQLSKLLARVEAGEVITIARGRTPVAKLVPVIQDDRKGRCQIRTTGR